MNPLVCKTVLLIDDSPIVRERIVSLLADIPGVEVIGEVDSAEKAITAIPKLNPSAIILDISMPGGSGFTVLEALQNVESAPLIIVLTNFAYDIYRKKCLKLGADYFFDKSTEFEELRGVLEKLPQTDKIPVAVITEVPKP